MARMIKEYPLYEATIILHYKEGQTWTHKLKETSTVRREVERAAHRWAKRALEWPSGAHQFEDTYEVIIRQWRLAHWPTGIYRLKM